MKRFLLGVLSVALFPVVLIQARKWRERHATGNYTSTRERSYKMAHREAGERSRVFANELFDGRDREERGLSG